MAASSPRTRRTPAGGTPKRDTPTRLTTMTSSLCGPTQATGETYSCNVLMSRPRSPSARENAHALRPRPRTRRRVPETYCSALCRRAGEAHVCDSLESCNPVVSLTPCLRPRPHACLYSWVTTLTPAKDAPSEPPRTESARLTHVPPHAYAGCYCVQVLPCTLTCTLVPTHACIAYGLPRSQRRSVRDTS